MLIGQTLFAPDADPFAVYYSPWFPRQGDSFTALVEVIKTSGAFLAEVQVQTKNEEQADASASSLGAVFSISAEGTATELRSGCLELVRYEITLSGVNADRWAHMRFNAPQWQPN